MIVCAECGKEMHPGETYLKVCDNYLQRNYFDADDESDNVFCSETCLKKALSVVEFDVLPEEQREEEEDDDNGRNR